MAHVGERARGCRHGAHGGGGDRVRPRPRRPTLFFSEYIEGTCNNKALEIYNGTGAAVDLTGYSVQIFFNALDAA